MSGATEDLVLIVGAGPAGLMAADVISAAGRQVIIADAMPSPARKFLMAGKSGLNLTKDEPFSEFVANFGPSKADLIPMLSAFGPADVRNWAHDLGQNTFVGSSRRVFPTKMKASPLLRALLGKLETQGAILNRRWRWVGWRNGEAQFETPGGLKTLQPRATVLSLGGASWSRLGSNGEWAGVLQAQGVSIAAFEPSNVGLSVKWSDHMRPHFGAPIKNIGLSAGSRIGRGEITISEKGLEGGGLYPFVPEMRARFAISFDLKPDKTLDALSEHISKAKKGQTTKETLRIIGLKKAEIALLNEFAHPLPRGTELADLIKS